MHKIFFTFIMCLLGTMMMSAQSLQGTWSVKEVSDGMPSTFTITFADKKATINVNVTANQEIAPGIDLSLDMDMVLPATYTQTASTLKFVFNKSQAKVNCNMDVTGVDAATKANMKQAMMSSMEEQKVEMVNKLARQYDNVPLKYELSGNRLLLDDKWLDKVK